MADPVDLKPVYLITGSDRPKIELAVKRLRSHFEPESIDLVSAQEASGAEVVNMCNAGSLFGDGRLVVVDGVDGRRNADDRLVNAWKAAEIAEIVHVPRVACTWHDAGAPCPGAEEGRGTLQDVREGGSGARFQPCQAADRRLGGGALSGKRRESGHRRLPRTGAARGRQGSPCACERDRQDRDVGAG